MMNFSNLTMCLLTGFAVPFLLASTVPAVRNYAATGLAIQGNRADVLWRWMIAFVCGPALLLERLVCGDKPVREDPDDVALGLAAACGWAALYGFVVLELVERLSA